MAFSDMLPLAAKASRQSRTDWLPLWMHLRDTAGVMEYLVNQWLPCSIKKVIFPQEEDPIRKIAVLLGATHDLGKATALFQSMILRNLDGVKERLQKMGLPISDNRIFREKGKSRHPIAGEAILLEAGFPLWFASIVGSHHGKPHGKGSSKWFETQLDPFSSTYVNYFDDPRKDVEDKWRTFHRQIIEEALSLSGYDSLESLPNLSMPAQMLLSGLLIMADWIVSNTEFFPLISVDERGKESDYPTRLERGLERFQLPSVWNPTCFGMDDQGFQTRFGFTPNAVQKEMLTAVQESKNPGIFILEAQMGVGKTEAALAGAELLGTLHQSGGLFFGLPTQATSNGLFPRIKQWATEEANADDEILSIRLAHGAKDLNTDYQKVFHGKAVVGEDCEEDSLMVHPWFEGNKQALLADFVVGTVDQLLLSALKQKHVMLRHLGIAGKVVIVDECHAYDTYMNQFLERALGWLGVYDVPVILLSATLPYERRTRLIQAYLGLRDTAASKQKREAWMTNKAYPLLTWTDGKTVRQKQIQGHFEKKKISLYCIHDQEIVTLLEKQLGEGGCAGIIVNTVRRAQKIATLLKESLKNCDILLFHAGFTRGKKALIEKQLIKRIGKKSSFERNHFIVVGTQVMEQSLDIDLDLLITDLCPMDLLFQRIGRVHRHKRIRPDNLNSPKVYILGANDKELLEEGTSSVYDEFLLERTKTILPNEFVIPDEISEYVQKVYDETYAIPIKNEAEIVTAYKLKLKKKKDAAQSNCLKLPSRSKSFAGQDTLEGLLTNSANYNDVQAEMSVRDGVDSVEVILLKQGTQANEWLDPNGGTISYYSDDGLSDEEVTQIANFKLRLPALFGKPYMIGQVIQSLEESSANRFKLWLHHPYLSGNLFLTLDNTGKGELVGYQVSYDGKTGFQYRKVEENEGT